MEKKLHRLLDRQLAKYCSKDIQQSAELFGEMKSFINAVNEAYLSYEEDHNQLERTLELSSNELFKLNERINAMNAELEQKVKERTFDLVETNKKLEDSLNELKNFKFALDCAAIVSITDYDGNITYANNKFCEISQYSLDELIGANHRIIKSGFQGDEFFKNLWDTIKSGKIWKGEIKNKNKSGNYYWVNSTIVPIFKGGDEPHEFLAIRFEITDRKNAELEIIERKNKYKSVVNSIKEVIFQTDAFGLWTFLNPSWTEITDFTLEESIGQNFLNYVHPDDRTRNAELFAPLIERKKDYCKHQIRYITKNGGFKWIEVFARLTLDENDNIIGTSGTLDDVTEKHFAEEQLRLFESSVVNSNDGVLITDANDRESKSGRIIFANKAFSKMTGYTEEEILGKTPIIFRGSGTDLNEISKLDNAIINGKSADIEVLNYRKDGSEFWVNFSVFPIEDKNGNITHWVSMQRDVTERRKSEEELKTAKRTAEKAAQVKSDFLSNMSHEIRTPLNAIIGLTDLLLHEKFEGKNLENLEAINFSASSLLAIINDILDFSKLDSGKMTLEKIDFDIYNILDQVTKVTRFRAEEKNLFVETIISKDIPRVLKGDPGKLNQIMINLTGNAVKFTNKGGIKISATKGFSDDYTIELLISVEDTGIGIPENKIKNIFESFNQAYTDISRRFGGTGLGLTITKKLVDIQGGYIKVYSREGIGSKFTFSINYDISIFKEISQVKKTEEFRDLKQIRILLVEDNVMNQFFIKQLLDKWNASFDVANNGYESIVLLRKNIYDVILLDLQMPDMNGLQVTGIIRDIRSDILDHDVPIIALTADISSSTKEEVFKCGMNDIAIKPISQDILYDVILNNLKC